jgi:SAM-dependent methyltransferase
MCCSPGDVSDGLEVLNFAVARSLARTYDFGQHRRILDLGGGTGSFLAVILQAHPGRDGTLFDVPTVARRVRQRLGREFPDGGIQVVEGDFFIDPIPHDHDVVILANVVHLFSPERNRDLLRRIRGVVPPATRLLLVDVWVDGSRPQPLVPALLAGEFLVATGEGGERGQVKAARALARERHVENVPFEVGASTNSRFRTRRSTPLMPSRCSSTCASRCVEGNAPRTQA